MPTPAMAPSAKEDGSGTVVIVIVAMPSPYCIRVVEVER